MWSDIGFWVGVGIAVIGFTAVCLNRRARKQRHGLVNDDDVASSVEDVVDTAIDVGSALGDDWFDD